MKIAYRDEIGVVVINDISDCIFDEGKCYFETVDEKLNSIDYCINVNQIVQICK